jgi:hypothetical protein
MAENVSMLLQEDVNKFYTSIINCEIIKPPHYEGRVPQTFFLRKRDGIEQYTEMPNIMWRVLDYIVFKGVQYILTYDPLEEEVNTCYYN